MSNKLIITLMAILSGIGPSACDDVFVIESPMVTNFGEWGEWEYCPKATFAVAAELKVYPNKYTGDDSGLNAIRLYCGDPQDPETPFIASSVGALGDWLPISITCPNQLNGFELKVEAGPRSTGDNVATTKARFQCIAYEQLSPRKLWYEIMEQKGISGDWSKWTGMQTCGPDYAICGIRTQVQPWKGSVDNTGLNNVMVACCELDPIPI